MTCAQLRECAPELALGLLNGAERAEALLHVNGCARCRAFVSELSEAVDVLVQLAPEADPPAGFEAAVAGRMRGDRRRVVRRWVAALASVAAATAIVSVVAVRMVEGSSSPTRREGPPSSELQASPMIGGGGRTVGRVFTYNGHPSYVSVAVAYGVPTGDYRVQLVARDGRIDDAGTVRIDEGKGSWGGTVGTSVDDLREVRVVDAAGVAVCSASFRAA